jgi:ABC-type antimicrobial peptide transport system permease subunit
MRREEIAPIEIVGVVKDAKYNSLRERTPRMIYLPYRQDAGHLWGMCLAVRTLGNPAGMAALIRRELQNIDPSLPVLSVTSMEEQLDDTLVQERLIALLSGFFSVLALLLASIGLYGVMSHLVMRTTGEIGVRMALGAEPGEVLWMIFRKTMMLTLIGIAIGIPGALAATRLVGSQLFGVTASDPVTTWLCVLLMLAVAAIAGYLPARRAARIDPMVALRYE